MCRDQTHFFSASTRMCRTVTKARCLLSPGTVSTKRASERRTSVCAEKLDRYALHCTHPPLHILHAHPPVVPPRTGDTATTRRGRPAGACTRRHSVLRAPAASQQRGGLQLAHSVDACMHACMIQAGQGGGTLVLRVLILDPPAGRAPRAGHAYMHARVTRRWRCFPPPAEMLDALGVQCIAYFGGHGPRPTTFSEPTRGETAGREAGGGDVYRL